MTKYLHLPLEEINNLLRTKKIKPIDLVRESFDRIKENKELNAFITLNEEDAIKEAIRLESEKVDNLLFGIPIAIKDNIITNNLRTTCASKMLDNFIPIYDATVVKKIKECKMIIIGKTNMDEFAMGSTGETSYYKPCLNPWNLTKTPGGSSSGSASSVSMRICPFALGSDTGGSIRQPSSFCGIVGLKPTYGRVSRYGLVAFSSSLDQIGPMTRNVYENALLLNAISGEDENDLTCSNRKEDFTSLIGQDIKGMKIAIPKFYISDVVDKRIKEKLDNVVNILKENGASVSYIDINDLEYAITLYQIIALGEASSNLARFDGIRYGYQTKNYQNLEELYFNTRSEGFGKEVKRRIMIGSYVLSGENANVYYLKALSLRKKLRDNFKRVFETYDLVIGPVTTSLPHTIGSDENNLLKSFYDDLFTIPVNMAGLPGMSLPMGFIENIPVGVQIIADSFDEKTIYKLASFLEKKLDLDLIPNKEGDHYE